MGIAVLGITAAAPPGLMARAKSFCGVACNAKPPWAWPLSSRPASLRWKPAAAPIIWDRFFGSGTHSSADVA